MRRPFGFALFLAVLVSMWSARASAQMTLDLHASSYAISADDAALPDAPSAVQAQNQTSPQNGTSSPAPTTTESKHDQAERELQMQEHQRMLGVIPNFNTVNQGIAAPLSARQKFRLAFRSMVDPFQFVAAGLDSGISQAEDDFPEYGQGAEGYAKRFGASYADAADGVLWGNAVLPALLHQDPRYYRKGTGSIMSRVLYSVATAVRTKDDNGKWDWNYSNVGGNIVAGGISNLYYPSSDRGVGLTFERAFTVTAEGAVGALADEFYPDIARRYFHKKDIPPPQTDPGQVTPPAPK